jgi:serine/threonine-protein kinase
MLDTSHELAAVSEALAPDFAVEREIGRGGMGVVYRGMDVRLERPVAIKVLPPALAADAEVRERFLREARTAARLSHPSIVPIHRADEMHGVVFIVMALIDGESLADRLAADRTLAVRELVPMLRDVAVALDHAHAHGVVHRDIKPENILLERSDGRSIVTDFGIARVAEAKPLTATGQVLGTVHYMSPEQISGDAVDGRSDFYSLGVVAFRALTGRLPFENEMASAILVAHVVKAPPKIRDVSPMVPPAIAAVIDRCLVKDPAARIQSGRELTQLLDDAAARGELEEGETPPLPNVLSEREARALWSRAAELQAMTGVQPRPPAVSTAASPTDAEDRRTLTSGYRATEVRDAAREAGISDRYVVRAARELGLSQPAPNDSAAPLKDETPAPSILTGAPMSIQYEVKIPGEVPESELYVLVDTIRRRMGEPGHLGTLGRSVSWSSSSKNRRLQVSIISRHGSTTIRGDERLGQLAGALFGGIVGGGGGGSTGISIGIGMSVFHSGLAAFGIWGLAATSSYALARTIFAAQARRRRDALRSLVLELADEARELMHVLPR